MQNNKLLGVSLSLLLVAGVPAVTFAPQVQSAELEEIIVTARKREESLQDVPISIQALDRIKIERYDADNLSEIADMANNVTISGGTNGAGGSFVIRGLGSNAGDSGISASVATNIDGVQSERGFIARTAFFDVESVQFLKGPQALFYGKNSPAGVVGVITANPTDRFEAKVSAGYEPEAEEQIFDFMVSGPLTDTLGARLAVRYTDIGGWIDNNAQFVENSNGEAIETINVLGFWPAEESYYDLPGAGKDIGAITALTARLTLQWEPTDDFRARAKFLIADEESDGLVAGEFANCTDRTDPRVAPIARPILQDPFHDCKLDNETSQGALPVEVARAWNNNQNGELGDGYFSNYEARIFSLDLQYQREWGTISAITGWMDYDFEGWDNFGGLSYPFFVGYNPDDHEQFSQEIRFATELDSPFNYMLGMYYESFERQHENASKLGLFGRDPVRGFSNDQHVIQFTEGDSWSVFGQVIWDINDQWELAVGGRYLEDEKDGTQRHEYVHPFLAILGWFPEGVDLVADTSDTDFSPEVTLTWRPNGDFTLWGAWKNGYKAGGYSAPTVLSGTFGPENITFGEEDADGFEVGVKTTLLQGRMRLNVTMYDYTFEDLQVSQFRPETTTYVIGNAASASTRGVEMDMVYQATENVQLYAEFGYNKAKQESYPNVACYAFQPIGPGECEGPDSSGQFFQDLSGQTLALAPEFSGSLGVELMKQVSSGWIATLSAEGIYTDDYKTASNGEPLAVQDSFWRLRARIGVQSADGKYDFSIIGRNLTDEIFSVGGARPGAITPSDQGGGGSRPRSILFQATYRI
ncbi:MAG: iron complex outermembrane receptor protein [Candidatus Azotimanducaceae bacterium]|jgi:iron complex outermembrane receptor protein